MASTPDAGRRLDIIVGQVGELADKGKTSKEEEGLPVVAVLHPLDPLTPTEIAAASKAVNTHAGARMNFDVLELLEPPKALVRAWKPGMPIQRVARTTSFKPGELGGYKAEVDLASGKVLKWEHVPGARPMLVGAEDFIAVWKAAAESEELKAALAKRGLKLEDEFLYIELWPLGQAVGLGKEQVEGRAPCMCLFWERLHNLDNHYAHPAEGLDAIFDRVSGKFTQINDRLLAPVPKEPVNYRAEDNKASFGSYSFKPLNITQPEGVSFTLDGHSLSWHKWQMHLSFLFREGLVLQDIQHDGRPVCYSARIAEMVVPYGGIQGPHQRKNVFDLGEVGFGVNANQLELGCDCKGSIQYLDAWIHEKDGRPKLMRNVVCIHEEDSGMLWKHSDMRGSPEVRRARRLAISSVHTVGNYEYACRWYFHMDGVIQFEMKATGIINTTGQQPECEKYGVEVSPGVWGQIHQHMFTAKLDMCVDGDANTVVEVDTVRDAMGTAGNPLGNAFYTRETPLASEQQAMRVRNEETYRFWKFTNPNSRSATGYPRAYKLEPVNSVKPMAWPESETGRRMRIYYKDLWVTRYDREERYPAGEFMHQSLGQDGLPKWTQADRPLTNTDVVAWYNFGLHHVVRPEDWPVQPCVAVGFMLHPVGFFDKNPTLDVPPERDAHSTNAKAEKCH